MWTSLGTPYPATPGIQTTVQVMSKHMPNFGRLWKDAQGKLQAPEVAPLQRLSAYLCV